MRDHFIVCGTGDVGGYVIEELQATKRPFVLVDADGEALKKLAETRPLLYVAGDATDEEVLAKAGVKNAAGVVCALPNDRDNLVLAMTCRLANAKVRIVAQAQDIKLAQRIKNAGADSVVSPQFIGGMRLVSEMVRPTVVSFLDRMLRDMEKHMRIEEVRIEAGSPLSGQQLKDQGIAGSDVLVMAIQDPGNSEFRYVPDSGAKLQPGSTLVVLGDADRVARLRDLAGQSSKVL